MGKKEIIQKSAEMKDCRVFDNLEASAVSDLIKRVTGSELYRRKFIIRKKQELKHGYDTFSLFDEGENIVIEANSGVSAAAGFNQYLKKICNCFVGPLSENLNLPENPPCVGKKIESTSLFLYRYFMNYCTYGYTTVFWKFEDYEKLLDWMMLSGINLVLNPVAHEVVWQKLLTELGYSEREIDNYLCGPAYMPWQWMGNMTRFGGDLPKWWYEDRLNLSNKINERLLSFGASPILPGFCGLVPLDFEEKFAGSLPLNQGLWCNGFLRPGVILPQDKMFRKTATLFYDITKKLFGKIHYFSADPFHEGGKTQGINLAEYGQAVINYMLENDENAVWVLQGWQDNPKREMLQKIDKSHLIVTNLRGDEIFDAGDNFADTPWMYCTVNNFGGTRNISGNVKKSIEDPFKITDSNYDTTIMGVGLMMESITIDEIFYDIINTISFCGAKPEIGDYISDFVKNRYGKNHPACCEAFNIMAHDIYMRGGINSPKESALCARPGFKVENVSTWGGKSMTYDKKALIKVLELLLSEYDCLNDNSCYRLDLCDAARQCVANNSWTWYEKMMEAYENEEVEIFENAAQIFLRHFDIQEDILKTNPNTLLGNWISKAESYGRSFSDKRMFRYNAMALITHWGDKQAAYELHDYAHKEWSGLLTDFYKTRWESFITLLSLNIHRHDEFPQIDWYEFEQVFATSAKDYPTSPTGNLKVAAENALKFLSKLD